MANDADFLSSLGETELLFRRMHAREELGRLPEYRIDLLRPTRSVPVAAKSLLGTRASVRLTVDGKDDTYRYINGVVTRFEQGGVSGRFDLYRVELRPWLWQLTLGADSRIFQDKTVVEILDLVFADYGATSYVQKSLSATFRSRPYTVQYRESDFDFVSRLMEEEGIYYFFKHTKEQHTLVLCDNASAHSPLQDENLTWAASAKAEQYKDTVVRQWNLAHALRSLKYTHIDFAADTPSVELKGDATRTAPYPKPNDLEVFDYPGGFEDGAMEAKTAAKQQEAERLAKLRVDAFESGHVIATGVTPYRHMAAGFTFQFVEHSPKKEGFLVTRVDYDLEFHGWESQRETAAEEFSCRFEAVPKETSFQPPPSTPRPVVNGPQTATVVGPAGDEIYTDKYGRVKLQFRWDRVGTKNERSSCWVRVSHPWAGKQFGMVALPRIGDEVVVEFLEGNPDRPLVTGRVYNGDNMPPYDLPKLATVSGIKTRSSKGGAASDANELRFDDAKGSEYIWLQAQKDFHQLVKNDSFESVKNNLWTDVTQNTSHDIGQSLTLNVGKQAIVKIGADTHATLGTDFNLDVGGALGVKVAEAVAFKGSDAIALTSGSGLDIKVGAGLNISATSAVNMKGLGVVIDGGTTLCIKAGGAFITLGPEGVTIQGTMVKINSGGSAGSANAAADASPTKPKAPEKPTANQDPLAS